MDEIRKDAGLESAPDEEWEEFLEQFDRQGSPVAYVFRCKHCGKLGGYQDCD